MTICRRAGTVVVVGAGAGAEVDGLASGPGGSDGRLAGGLANAMSPPQIITAMATTTTAARAVQVRVMKRLNSIDERLEAGKLFPTARAALRGSGCWLLALPRYPSHGRYGRRAHTVIGT